MKRYKALDIFRGMTICLMIIVNTHGAWSSVFASFQHTKWHGFTLADLVFPSFLFAVGTSFAFVKNRYEKDSPKKLWRKIVFRSLLIFLLGYIMNWFPFMKWNEVGELTSFPIGETRIWGVLQRIAACYFLATLMIFYLSKKSLIYVSIGILLAYWAVLYGFGDYTLENNAIRHLDLFLFGESHLFAGKGIPFDPEGVLSTFPAIVNVIGGYLIGAFFIENRTTVFEKAIFLGMIGVAMVVFAGLWHFAFPFNKNLWTSSFVVLTVGINIIMIGILMLLTDLNGVKVNFNFFEIFGRNSLFIYLFSQYLAITMLFVRVDGKSIFSMIYEKGFAWIGSYYGSCMFGIVFMLVCWAVSWWLDRKKIYIRI